MKLLETPLQGAYTIECDKREDERGFFARLFCEREFAANRLETHFVQVNNSLSRQAHTLRGLHYQLHPASEVKVLRAIAGGLWDVIVDLRRDSPTFGQHFGTELTAANRRMIYVPRDFAHGFMTLEANTEVLYLVSAFYAPEHERGIRWNDPRFGIAWPREPAVLSDKDRSHPDFSESHHLGGPAGPSAPGSSTP